MLHGPKRHVARSANDGRQTIYVGIDIGKSAHHACAIDDRGSVVLSRRVINDQHDLEGILGEVRNVDAEAELVWAVDLTSELATMVLATLLGCGQTVFYVPGRLVNSMSHAFRGEGKTDARDAKVIAQTLRLRDDLTLVAAPDELVTTLSVLTRYRSELNGDWVAGVNRLRSLLMSIFPGLERSLDFTSRTALTLVAELCTPAELRRAGVAGIEKHLRKHRCWAAGITKTAQAAHQVAVEQTLVVPGEADIATVIKRSAQRLLDLDREIKNTDKTITARFRSHQWARSIESIPGIGPTLGAEFIVAIGGNLEAFGSSGRLASFAGLVPVPQDSGRIHGNLRRPRRYNRRLRRVFYLAAFASLPAKGESWEFYQRKRSEGHKHNQAVICLARRLVDVLWALIRDDREFTPRSAGSVQTAA